MPIIGIDIHQCNLYKNCIKECPLGNFSMHNEERRIIFDMSQCCILCGHCIAVCPEQAIKYKDMNDHLFGFEESKVSISNKALNKLILSKRSIRQYKNKKIPKDIIEKVINIMRFAPTAMNKPP